MPKIDLDKFPTSPTAKRMLKRVSPIYGSAYTGKWIFQVLGQEYDEVRRYFEETRAQAFVATTTWGIEAWEDRYSLEHPRDLTIEERRERIRRRRTTHLPLNPANLEKMIADNFSQEVDIDESHSGYIYFIIDRLQTFNIAGIRAYLYDKKPSHLAIYFVHHWSSDKGKLYTGGVVQGCRHIELGTKMNVSINISDGSQVREGGVVGNIHKYNDIK